MQTSFATGTSRTYTPGAIGRNSKKQRTVICYNYKGEGHISKQCTKPKRKQDDSWFKDKVLLVQAQANGQILHEEELAFWADPGTAEDALAEVHNPDNVDNNMINQGVQVIPSSEQSNVEAVQNSGSSSQQDALILSSIEIDRLKQTLSEHVKEKESLMQTVTLLKNDFKKEESRKIDRDISLEKKIKQLDNIHSKLNANSELLCVKCNGCMLSDNHDLCVLDFINDVNARTKSKSRPTGRTFTIVGNAFPLTRITTTAEVPLRKPTALESDTLKPIVTLVYSRKPRNSKTNVPVSKPKIIKSISANKKEPNKSWGSIVSDVPSSSLDECRSSKLFSEGLGHNLFSVGKFCDSNLEVAFRQHTCFIRNLEGVDLLTGSRGNNLYTLSLGDMMVSFPICLLSKASKTKS
ncbi:hypothetical protein Tco_0837438 [Tanacetum coccineum]